MSNFKTLKRRFDRLTKQEKEIKELRHATFVEMVKACPHNPEDRVECVDLTHGYFGAQLCTACGLAEEDAHFPRVYLRYPYRDYPQITRDELYRRMVKMVSHNRPEL